MDLVAPSGGGNVRTTDRMGGDGLTSGNYRDDFGGTSAACPQVSGTVALILSANPQLSESQVRHILQETATDMGSSGFDNTFGYGRLNASAALLEATGGNISGSGPVCYSSNNTFSMNGETTGLSFSWTKSSNLTAVSGSSSSTYTVKAASSSTSGEGWVRVTIMNDGNETIDTREKHIKINLPAEENVTFDPVDGTPMWPSSRYDVSVSYPYGYGINNYYWRVWGATIENGQGTDQITIRTTSDPNSVVAITMDLGNSCGTGEYFTHYPLSGNPYSTSEMSVHPVPADNQLIVSIEEEEQDKTQTLQTREYEYYLYNERYRLVRQFTTDMTKVQIQTRDLPGGFYFLNVVRGNKVWRRKIEIRH
jgi:hypothetical protein